MSQPQHHSREKTLEADFDKLPPYQNIPYGQNDPLIVTTKTQPWYLRASTWLIISAMSSLLLGSLVMSIQSYLSSLTQLSWISALLLASNLLFITLLLWISLRELNAYRRINQLVTLPNTLITQIEQGHKESLITALKQLTKMQSHGTFARQCYQRFWQTLQPHHSAHEIQHIYQNMVAEPLKAEAERLVQPAMLQAAGISLLSPNNLVHSLILFWRSIKLIRDIAAVYGVRPGLFGSFTLLRVAIENMIIQQGMDIVIDAGVNRLSHSILSKVVEKGSEATTTSLLLRRLAKAMIQQLDILNNHAKNAK